jgi:putative intracellular protease/amidase
MQLTTSIFNAIGALSILSIPITNALTALAPNTTQTPLRIGVLYEQVQLSDLIGLDFLGHQTPDIMSVNAAMNPAFLPLLNLTTPMSFLYISSSLNITWTTPKLYVKPTHTYESAPRDLDILVLGGPNYLTVKEASLAFLREASRTTKIIMTTCSGAMWLAKSGALDGKRATTNRVALETARKLFPKVQWMDRRWVVEEGLFDGAQIWMSGGAGCGKSSNVGFGGDNSLMVCIGVDMFIEFTRTRFSEKLTEVCCRGLDFECENRSQFYDGPLLPSEV